MMPVAPCSTCSHTVYTETGTKISTLGAGENFLLIIFLSLSVNHQYVIKKFPVKRRKRHKIKYHFCIPHFCRLVQYCLFVKLWKIFINVYVSILYTIYSTKKRKCEITVNECMHLFHVCIYVIVNVSTNT